jgi:hypothetical protein
VSRKAQNKLYYCCHFNNNTARAPCEKIKSQGEKNVLSLFFINLLKTTIPSFLVFISLMGLVAIGASARFNVNAAQKSNGSTNSVVIVQNKSAVDAYLPKKEAVRTMLERGILEVTGSKTFRDALGKIISTNETVGIKVYSTAGPFAGTRPAVVEALVSLMIDSGFAAKNIIIWDKNVNDLLNAGYDKIAKEYGVRIAGAVQSGYDETMFYEKPLIGNLVYGDLEFNKKGEGIGRKSYFSKLITKEIKKIISVAPLLNNNVAGVSGHLYSISLGSVDNTSRFESNKERLNEAVPEIFAMPAIYDRAALFITDALICQYEGTDRAMLHYSTVLGQLRLSRDPVALDTLSLEELQYQRVAGGFKPIKADLDLVNNAQLLELGIADTKKMNIKVINLNN